VRTPTPLHPCPRGPLISVEGITGVGKSHLTAQAVDAMPEPPFMLDAFTQRAGDGGPLDEAILCALREGAAGDPFLRGGAPLSETLLLLAIKRHDLEVVLPHLSCGQAVIEGRSPASTAVCQALLLHPGDPRAALQRMFLLMDVAASFRPLPDLTILITDQASAAIDRAERRDQRIFTAEQTVFMEQARDLFEQLAQTDPEGWRIVDRRTSGEHEAVQQIHTWIDEAGDALGCLGEPWAGPRARCVCCQRPTGSPIA